jgi:hypothetical protein
MTEIKKKVFYMAYLGGFVTFALLIYLSNIFLRSPSTLNLFLLMYVGFSFLGFLLYVFRKHQTIYELNAIYGKRWVILTIFFLIVVAGILFVLKSSIYIKPLSYYVLVSLAAALIGIQIIENRVSNKILFQILILAFLIRSSSLIINPYLFGADSYWHFNRIMNIIKDGHLASEAGHYYYFPSFHIFISFFEKIGTPTEVIYSTASLILSLIAVPTIYLLTRNFLGEKTGLMSSLLLSISVFHIFGSINYSPMINGFSLILISFYILIKFIGLAKTSEFIRTWIIFWLVALSVFFIHPVASMSLGLILGANFVLTRFFFKNNGKGLTPFYSYIVGFIAYLMFVHFMLFREIVEVIFIPGESQPLPSIKFVSPTTKLLTESALSFLGPASLVFFGVYGGLMWMENYNLKKMSVLLSLMLLYSIPLYSFIRGVGGLDPGRLLSYIEALIVIPAATSIIYLSSTIKNSKYKLAMISSVLVFLSFFSTFSYITWDGNQILKDKVEVPVGFATQSSLAAYPFLQKLPKDMPLYSDHRTSLYLANKDRGIYGLPDIVIHRISYRTLNESGYFGINKEYLERIMWKSDSERELFLDTLDGDDKIYDNGNVQIFMK